MAQLTVQVDDEIVRALELRSARHGRSAEAEHREILRVTLRRVLPTKSFKDHLLDIPDVGDDEDFARIEGPTRSRPSTVSLRRPRSSTTSSS